MPSKNPFRVRFALPVDLGSLKIGDRVAVQVMWVTELRWLSPRMMRIAELEDFNPRFDRCPMLSQRLQVVVTENLLSAQKSAATQPGAK